ncbi:hypothetical protein ACHAW5_006912 [Stephanodiscus triporus]|uniref:OTU domain-containing protein n=1 Tax=Stephanodiscus triporus TaxID=2934178 RepID=A0ABD3NP27_9STRA
MAKQKRGKGKKKSSPPRSNGKKDGGGGEIAGGRRRRGQDRHPDDDDDDDDDANFRHALLDQGRIVMEMAADGNCLFRSLSDQINRDGGAMHDVVRREVCDYLSRNGEEFRDFLLIDDDDEDVSGVEGYVNRMREDGQWGGNVEVVVASRAYGRNIIVFSSEYSNGALSIGREDDEHDDDDDGARGPLMLSYHGNDHYNSVRPVHGGPSSGGIDDGGSRRSSKSSGKNKGGSRGDAAAIKDNARASVRPTRSSGREREGRRPAREGKIKSRGSARPAAAGGEDDCARESDEGDEKEDGAGRFIGRFRVLTI